MAARSKEQHQPEPWKYEGRAIVNSAGWTLAKTIFEADARRIVAAVNDVLGIPTAALEAGFIREILVPRPETTSEFSIRVHPLPPTRWIRRSSFSTTAGWASGGAASAATASRPRPGSSRSPTDPRSSTWRAASRPSDERGIPRKRRDPPRLRQCRGPGRQVVRAAGRQDGEPEAGGAERRLRRRRDLRRRARRRRRRRSRRAPATARRARPRARSTRRSRRRRAPDARARRRAGGCCAAAARSAGPRSRPGAARSPRSSRRRRARSS